MSAAHPRTGAVASGEPAASAASAALPWPSLLTLGAVTFTVVAAEMLPTAVLPAMSADLGVPASRTGLLVSAWALMVVVASFPLVRLTRRVDGRGVIAGAVLVLGASSAVTAAAGSFGVALGSRLVGAAACGLLWATVNAHSAAIVPPDRLARSVAVVLGGATLGTVLGVPAASAAADVWGWRTGFVGVAVVSLPAAAAVLTLVRPAPGAVAPGPETSPAAPSGASALRPVLVTAALGGLLLVGHFAAYTFVAPLLAGTAARTPGGLSGLLLGFGVLSAVGTVLVGRVGDRRPALALVATAAAVTVVLALLGVLGRAPAVDLALVAVWGLATGAFPPLAQTAIMRAAGPRLRSLAGTLIPVTFNLGIAVGAAAGSAVVAAHGLGALPLPAAAVAAAATLALAAVALRPRPERRTRA
ncbi:MFS transporter [Cellulomonas endometrii]|uniref:MFS transporter n=1 Tax=Cellulomonas endometrii TaxID=3036301 RepID=UPI0024ADA421|nr:MFS transporter [Cellulomonas endometrii]